RTRRSGAGAKASRHGRRRLRVPEHAPPALWPRHEREYRQSSHQVAVGPVADDHGSEGRRPSQNRGARIMNSKPAAAPKLPPSPLAAVGGWSPLLVRCALTALVLGGYYFVRAFVDDWYARTSSNANAATPRIIGVTLVLIGLIIVWWRLLKKDPRFQAPLLVTTILAVGDAAFGILENHTAPAWL